MKQSLKKRLISQASHNTKDFPPESLTSPENSIPPHIPPVAVKSKGFW